MVMWIHAGSFIAFPSAQERAVVEHILGHRIQGPKVTLARISRLTGHFYEAVIETEIVTDGVLPRRKLLLVVTESGEKMDRY